jgi:hypothetical protein
VSDFWSSHHALSEHREGMCPPGRPPDVRRYIPVEIRVIRLTGPSDPAETGRPRFSGPVFRCQRSEKAFFNQRSGGAESVSSKGDGLFL